MRFRLKRRRTKAVNSTLSHLLSPSQIVGRKQSLNTAIAHCAVEYNGLCGKCRMWLGQAALRWGLRYACPSVEYARFTDQTLIHAQDEYILRIAGNGIDTSNLSTHQTRATFRPVNQPTRPAHRDCPVARSRLSRIPTARVVPPRLCCRWVQTRHEEEDDTL